MKKIILFLGGSHSQVPAIKYAKEVGLHVIVADYLPDNPGQEFADEYYNISTTDKEKIYELAKNKKIDAITSFASDPAAQTDAYVSEKLGLIGNNIDTIKILSNKDLFRKKMDEFGLLIPKFISSNKLEDLLKFYKKINIPKMILKPVDASGSKGVYFISNIKDIENNFKNSLKESLSGKVILEEFIQKKGPQIHGEGFVVNGKLEFLYLGDQYFDKNKQLIPFSTIVPSIEHKDIMDKAFELTEKFIKKVNFKNGGINVEIIRDQNDNLFLLEIGARSGGNFMPQLIKYATNVDLVKANIDILFNKKINLSPLIDNNFHYAQIILHAKKDGYLKKISTPRELNAILMQKIYYNIGEQLKKYKSSRDVVGVNIFKVNNRDLQNVKYEQLLYKQDFIIVE